MNQKIWRCEDCDMTYTEEQDQVVKNGITEYTLRGLTEFMESHLKETEHTSFSLIQEET